MLVTLWDKTDFPTDEIKVESKQQALDLMTELANDPSLYPQCRGWSLTDDRGFWIIEEGEKAIPLNR